MINVNVVDTILTLALLSVLFSFGSSRLPALIKVLAFQGVVVSIVPFFIGHEMTTGSIVFTLATLLIRGIGIPVYVYLAIRKVAIGREVEPIVGYNASLLAGLLLIVGAIFVSPKFNLPAVQSHVLLLPTAVTLVVAGMFLLMARRNAIAMVLGYIMMENGIYLIGTSFSVRAHHIVEFGILLDVLAGVMIMAIVLRNIKKTFDDVDTALLRTLKGVGVGFMVELVILLPFITGFLAFFSGPTAGRMLLVLTGAVHLGLSLALWAGRPTPLLDGYFAVTAEGLISLLVISLLFLLIAIYTRDYLRAKPIPSESIFTGSMLLFLATMTMVTLADHIMVMWIAIEATTLASAPLIYTHRSAASIEATWKYVLICSVGIALALLGSVLLALSMDLGQVDVPMSFSALTGVAAKLDPLWLKTGFVFILVGYGTKMGLAPMHTWLPDAHSEAPSPASALLSGVLLNCAYLGIFKTHAIMHAAGLGDFSGTVLIVFGLASIIAAATFILKQTEYKRLLAYSSIENMGIIAFGTGIGGLGAYGAVLCLIHHSLIKSSLFLCSGNILLGYASPLIERTGRLAGLMPRTFVAFFGGFAGISGFPPFGIFLGEVFIVIAAFRANQYLGVALFILSICVIFAGFANHVMRISFGESASRVRFEEKPTLVWPQYALLLTSVLLCIWMPDTVSQTIVNAVQTIGGGY